MDGAPVALRELGDHARKGGAMDLRLDVERLFRVEPLDGGIDDQGIRLIVGVGYECRKALRIESIILRKVDEELGIQPFDEPVEIAGEAEPRRLDRNSKTWVAFEMPADRS